MDIDASRLFLSVTANIREKLDPSLKELHGVPDKTPSLESDVSAGRRSADSGLYLHEYGSVPPVSCPSGCKADHGVWGTDTYSGHSHVCLAAIHAGLSSDDGGGEFTLILGDARPAFRGSKRNGVQSGDWGDYNVSFRLQR